MMKLKEQIHVIDNQVTVEEIIKDVVKTKEILDPFYVFDVGELVNKVIKWQQTLPRIKPFYSVKCNDNSLLLEILAVLGINFNCTSKGEIKQILDLGVNSSRIIFSTPAKIASHIKYAKSTCINLTKFDSKRELFKIKSLYPSCKLLIELSYGVQARTGKKGARDAVASQHPSQSTPDGVTKAQCPLGIKYGCNPLTEAPSLMAMAYNLGLSVVGVSFYVDSKYNEPTIFRKAIIASAHIFKIGQIIGFKNMHLLSIGGGFPGNKNTSLDNITDIVNDTLNKWFPPNNGVTIIAEPGRYFVTSAFTLSTKIHSIKNHSNDENHIKYFINDGVYGSFNNILYDHSVVVPKSLYEFPMRPICQSSIWGPTCDDLDQVVKFVNMPLMEMGECIIFEDMGAYTISIASKFSGFSLPKILAVANDSIWKYLKNSTSISESYFSTMSIIAVIKTMRSESSEDDTYME